MKKIFYAFAAILMLVIQFHAANAQGWQWAKRGGGKTTSTSGTDDELRAVAMDKNGNSYILTNVVTNKLTGDIDVDGNKLGKGNGVIDICITSFDCSGKFRWSKIIGGRNNDVAFDLKLDTLGGVYITGTVMSGTPGDTVWFDADTTYGTPIASPKPLYKTFFIAKYDTSGTYKWLRFPEPDTLSSFSKSSGSVSIEVTPNGVISLLTYLGSSGAFANGSYIIPIATSPALHMLKYDANGNFIKGFPMNITEGDVLSLTNIRMAWDVKNDVYYLLSLNIGGTGVIYPKFGSTKMTGTNCLAKFSNTGSNLWVRQTTSAWYTGVLSSEPKIDDDGNIYIGTSEGPGGNFNGYTATNTLAGANSVPVVIKLDPSGNNIWGYHGSSSIFAKGSCVSISKSGEVAFAGNWVGQLKFGTNTANSIKSDIFLIKLDAATGALKSFDSVKSGDESISAILTTDRNGNFYLGGSFRTNLNFPSAGMITNYGGKTDFFVAKFGESNCNEPVSIVEKTAINSSIKIYPNPAQDVITFEGLEKGSEVRLFSVLGQQVQNFVAKNNKEQVAINHLASGMYLVQIHNTDGEVYSAKIVKE